VIRQIVNWARTLAGSRFACYPVQVLLVPLTISGSLPGLPRQQGDDPDCSM